MTACGRCGHRFDGPSACAYIHQRGWLCDCDGLDLCRWCYRRGMQLAHDIANVEIERIVATMPPERITAAAILVNGEVWWLPPPTRHHTLIAAYASAHWKDGARGRVPNDHEQGFVTSTGRFVDRYEARKIAEKADQILDRERCAAEGGQLFSEDVW